MRIERFDFEIEARYPTITRIILFFMLPKFIYKCKLVLKIGAKECDKGNIYFIPRFKVTKLEC